MEYNLLGNTGISVSRIALGCGFRGLYDVEDAVKAIDHAIDSGINFIDCANVYRLRSGSYAEEALGQVLRRRRNEIIITSKFGAPFTTDDGKALTGASATVMRECVEISLRRLNTDHIDFYLLHGPDGVTPVEETVKAFSKLYAEGKIRHYGLCNHSYESIERICKYASENGLVMPSVIQNPYSLINRSCEKGSFPLLKRYGMGFMGYSPLGTGLLGGAFSKGKGVPEKSTWGHDENYKRYLGHLLKGRVGEVIEAVGQIAEVNGTSHASVAAAWVLGHEDVSACILGCDNPIEIDDALKCLDSQLSSGQLELLDSVSDGLCESLTAYEVANKVKRLEGEGI